MLLTESVIYIYCHVGTKRKQCTCQDQTVVSCSKRRQNFVIKMQMKSDLWQSGDELIMAIGQGSVGLFHILSCSLEADIGSQMCITAFSLLSSLHTSQHSYLLAPLPPLFSLWSSPSNFLPSPSSFKSPPLPPILLSFSLEGFSFCLRNTHPRTEELYNYINVVIQLFS